MASSSSNVSEKEKGKQWTQYLEGHTVSDVLASDFKLVQVKASDKIPDVVRALSEARVQSAPVYNEETKEYVGSVSMFDVAATVVVMSEAKQLIDELSHHKATWHQFLTQENDVYSSESVEGMCNVSERNPWCPVWEGTPLLSLMDMFGDNVNLHRVAVVSDDGRVLGIVTQSRVLQWIKEHLDRLADSLALKPIGEWCDKISSSSKPVRKISVEATALDGYRLCVDKQVSGVAVVDQAGQLVDCLSVSDLGGYTGADVFLSLYKPVPDYLAKSTRRDADKVPVCCSQNASLKEVVGLLVNNRVHRLFVVDEEHKPIAVLTLCDIISALQIY